jgi:hypothetical protein
MVPFSLFPPSRKLLCSTRRLSSSNQLIKAKLEPGGLHGEAKDSPYRNQVQWLAKLMDCGVSGGVNND